MNKDIGDISIFWFRRDLRLQDNVGLYHALSGKIPVLPVFIFDTQILDQLQDKKDRRVAFIHEALQNINAAINTKHSSLFVLHDEPMKAFQKICAQFKVKEVFTNHDYEPYATQRDASIKKYLAEKNISFHTYKDQVIFERAEVMKSDGTPYTIFTPFSRVWKQKLHEEPVHSFPSEKKLDNLLKIKPFDFPSLKQIGFENIGFEVAEMNTSKELITNYDDTRNIPSVKGTSMTSVSLRFGTVSVRSLVSLAQQLNEKWLNELIWREFFMMILFHFPKVIDHNFKTKYDAILWRNNEQEFDLWCKGETGYPIVDAGMRQLNETGWMHNRVRMIVAGFLCKHLLIDWRWGEAYFAEKLLDYELSSNNGNWQWAAGTGCDAAPYFRIFNPSEQIKKFDPQLVYIKRWIINFRPGYLPEIVKHDFARKRAIEVYKTTLDEVDK
jgi:deoxyribodipyrimidine photo-lyase